MHPIEIHCKRWLLRKGVGAITLYPFIFYNNNHDAYKNDLDALRRHEMVHVDQVKRLGWLKFYLSYINLNFLKGKEYGKGKYEKEAYEKQRNG